MTVKRRLRTVDRVRGLAVLLMVLDHALAVTVPSSPVRYTLTRLSLPLFMAAAATVWRGNPSRRRIAQLVGVAIAETAAWNYLGLGEVGIVATYGLVLALIALTFPAWTRSPYLVAVVCLCWALYRPVGWSGYEPGLVAFWWLLGRMNAHDVQALGSHLPDKLEAVGRHPYAWYLCHLGLLCVAVAIW